MELDWSITEVADVKSIGSGTNNETDAGEFLPVGS